MKKINNVTTNSDEYIGLVYTTTDYKKFKTLDGNRSVKSARVQKIIDSINTVGYRRNPIVINEKFEVIDGQGRLAALEELNLPVLYVIDHGAGIAECRAMNVGMTNWNSLDFIRSYGRDGKNRDYKMLLDIYDEYFGAGISLDAIILVCSGWYSNSCTQEVRKGEFKFRRDFYKAGDWIKRFADTRKILSSIGGTPRQLFGAMMFAVEKCGCDVDRVFDRVNSMQYDSYRSFPQTAEAACQLIEDLYNFHKRPDSRVYISTEWKKYVAKKKDDDKMSEI